MKNLKNKINLIVFFIILLCTSIFVICSKGSDKVTLDEVKLKEPEKSSGMFAIMLEQNDGHGDYKESEDNIFPTIGYIYNNEKSGCRDDNGNEIQNVLSYDALNKRVSVSTNKTIYCYLYFKKDSTKPTIGNITLKGTAENGFELTSGYTHTKDIKISTSWEDDDVESYCISMESNSNNCNWENV